MFQVSKLSKANQAGFRMFKAICTGGLIGLVCREAYIRLYWQPRVARIDEYYKRVYGRH